MTHPDVITLTIAVIITAIPLQSIDAQFTLLVRRAALHIRWLLLQRLTWGMMEPHVVVGAQVLVVMRMCQHVMLVLLLVQLLQEVPVADLVRCGQVM